MHDPIAGGARCAQACVIMALATLADRGARILRRYELTWLGKYPYQVSTERDESCLEHRGRETLRADFPYEKVFAVDGLTWGEISRLLRDPECGTTVDPVYLPPSWTDYRRCKRLMEAYLSARFPVIVLVDAGAWFDDKRSVGHAVMIVDIRRASPLRSVREDGGGPDERIRQLGPHLPEVTEFIVHDAGFQPFVQRPVKLCLKASWGFHFEVSVGERRKCFFLRTRTSFLAAPHLFQVPTYLFQVPRG